VAAEIAVGSVVSNRFEVLSYLGQGGMGEVWKARDLKLSGDLVALKFMRTGAEREPRLVERFKAEVSHARRVNHDNVCRIYDLGEDGSRLFFSMEFVTGIDLKRLVREQNLAWEEKYDIALQATSGLVAIHESGVIHRDLKLANLMRDTKGRVRVMDFGIAKGWSQEAQSTDAVGTPEYMSPEQFQGLPLDPRTDVYSFGVMLYELFSGHVPFRGDSPAVVMQKHHREVPDFSGPVASLFPPALVPVIQRAMAKDRDQRYQSARELRLALEEARDGLGPTDALSGASRPSETAYPPQALLLVPTLMRALQSADRAVRAGAARALERTPDARARDALLAVSGDPDAEVRHLVGAALARLRSNGHAPKPLEHTVTDAAAPAAPPSEPAPSPSSEIKETLAPSARPPTPGASVRTWTLAALALLLAAVLAFCMYHR